MIKTDYLTEQVRRLLEGMVGVRQKLVRNELPAAETDLDEILRDAETLLADAPGDQAREVRALLAQVCSEKAMIRGARNDLAGALAQLERAVGLLEPHVGEGIERIEHLYDTTLLNLGAMHAATRNIDAALARLDSAITRLRPDGVRPDAPRQRKQLWMGALKNRATAREQKRDLAGAIRDYEAACDCASELVESGDHASSLAPLVNMLLRMAGLRVPTEGAPAARKDVERAMEAAKRAVELEVKGFETLYLRAKIAMADACFGTGDLAAGEDHIFAAIDAMPELLDTLLVAVDFYTALWGKTDAELEEGGLPRDEVGDSYAELLAKLDAACSDNLIKSIVRARYDLIVNDRVEPAAALLKKYPDPDTTNPRRAALHQKLQAALRSRTAH